MSYTTVALVREIVGKYAIRDTELTDGRIQDAIDSADGLIDGYLSEHYIIPLQRDGVPVTGDDKLISRLSCDLAAYDCVLTYQGSQDIGDNDPVVRRRSNAMQTLQSVSTGKVQFPYDTAAEEDNANATLSTYDLYQGNLFGPEDFAFRPGGPDRGGYFSGYGPNSGGTW